MSNQKRFALLKQHEIGTLGWNEGAQDAVGSILVDSSEINFTYTDATPSITAALINGSIVFARLQDADAVSVLGRSANSAGVLDEIAAAANDRLLRRTSDTINFGQLTVGMAPDAVWTFAKLQNADAVSVLGRSANSSGVMDEIAAGANDRLLRRTSDALNFGQLTAGMFPNTVVPDAALSSNVPLLNAANVFSGTNIFAGVRISSTVATFRITEQDAAADNGVWDFLANGEAFAWRAVNDAITVASAFLLVNRTGTTIDEIELNATLLDFNGALDLSGAATIGGLLTTVLSATGGAGFRLPHGAAPTAPVDGDMWTTTAGLFVRINGATVGPLS